MFRRLEILSFTAAFATTLGGVLGATSAHAQDCFIGEICMFGGNFAPRNWALTDGQLLPIGQNTALFSILGTTYGGDGRTTFALPDLRGRSAVHPGNGPGLPSVSLGQKGGATSFTLSANQMPIHTHQLVGTMANGNANNPADALMAVDGTDIVYNNTAAADNNMRAAAIGNAGGGQAVSHRSPYLGINHIICLAGLFPSRN